MTDDLELVKLRTEVSRLRLERDALHKIVRDIVNSLDNGSAVGADATTHFLRHAPASVFASFRKLRTDNENLLLQLDDARDREEHLREALRMSNVDIEKLETAMSCPWHPDGKHYCEPCGKSVNTTSLGNEP